MKSKIKCKFSKKIWRLKEEFKTSNRRNDTNQVVTIEAIIKKNKLLVEEKVLLTIDMEKTSIILCMNYQKLRHLLKMELQEKNYKTI